MSSLRQRLDDANVRVEKLIWIPGAVSTGTLPENLKDAIVDDLFDGDNEQVLSNLPDLRPILESEEDPDPEWIVDVLSNTEGYLVQLARPVPTAFYGSGGYSYSWGYYSTEWVYASNMDELVTVAEAFSKDVVDRARAEQVAA